MEAFEQYGFIYQKQNETHFIGSCPFCSKNKHFYINKKTKKWDCKRCGKSGGHISFIKDISEHTIQYFKGEKANKLKKYRGIRKSTFRKHDVGFNQFTKKYILPIKNSECKIINIKLYKIGGKLFGTTGCKTSLYNIENLKDTTEKIWLCEGEPSYVLLWNHRISLCNLFLSYFGDYYFRYTTGGGCSVR